MPFDNQNFSAPPVQAFAPVGDEVLRWLVEGRAIIANAARWCRRARVNAAGQVCSWGALRLVNGDQWECEAETYLSIAAKTMGYGGYIEANDSASHAVVVAMWDRAIAARKAELAR